MVYAGLWFCELPGLGKGEEGRRVPGELSEENGHEVDPFLTARFVSIRLRRWQRALFLDRREPVHGFPARRSGRGLAIM